MTDLEVFTAAYIECAIWASDDNGELSFGSTYLSPEARLSMEGDCAAFFGANRDLIGDNLEKAGHDFWLTRNRHGAGFWDRTDETWNRDARDKLTDAARATGERYLYVQDGEIFEEGA